ncbi:CBS domain-containing protein [Streptomyces sp. NBC_01142]|uniref:CBS domain-containing protein n=1 Tax=Streptomyces sp. NBC_01142 TaxID=2975865 RepID=UPI002254E82F|nr:CBS domain-containing protein [Streptomyces sp. NBC_01142]MCX4824556.1 CBS domain-containing protein [Streptomyces sp. NBC_01142]
MGSPGPQVGDDMIVDLALSVLIGAGVGHLLVRDEDGRCAGLVTRAQLTAYRRGSWYSERTRLRDIVHDRGPFTSSVTSVHEAERVMRSRKLAASPVIDEDGYTLGVLALAR